LFGGSGHDTFVFDTKAGSSNYDTIDDFSVKDDIIVLDHLIFRGIGKAGDLNASAFYSAAGGKAHDASDRVIYNSKTGDLYFDADGNGSSAAVKFAHLDAGLKLTAADFDLI
jgi:Ca2+-binding RTX toxin-like protein